MMTSLSLASKKTAGLGERLHEEVFDARSACASGGFEARPGIGTQFAFEPNA